MTLRRRAASALAVPALAAAALAGCSLGPFYQRPVLDLPPAFRANAAVGNVDGFYDAFGVKPGNRLYRAPVERVRIW